MELRKAGLAAVAAVTVGAGVVGGAAIATASDGGEAGLARYGYGTPPGGPAGGERPWALGGPVGEETEVTGDALADVTAAVEGYDATLTVEHVSKADDGSYLVLATGDDEERTALTVSADLATVTEAPAGGPGDHGHGPGRGPGGEEVTGDELADVTAAVQAFDAALTVEHVVQRGDSGDYLVLATGADDQRTALTVSADLETVEEQDGPPMGGPGHGGPMGDPMGGSTGGSTGGSKGEERPGASA